jgi:hypothetical protein
MCYSSCAHQQARSGTPNDEHRISASPFIQPSLSDQLPFDLRVRILKPVWTDRPSSISLTNTITPQRLGENKLT